VSEGAAAVCGGEAADAGGAGGCAPGLAPCSAATFAGEAEAFAAGGHSSWSSEVRVARPVWRFAARRRCGGGEALDPQSDEEGTDITNAKSGDWPNAADAL